MVKLPEACEPNIDTADPVVIEIVHICSIGKLALLLFCVVVRERMNVIAYWVAVIEGVPAVNSTTLNTITLFTVK